MEKSKYAMPRYLAEAEGATLVMRRDRVKKMLKVLENSGLGDGENAARLREEIEQLGRDINAKQAEVHQQNRTIVRAVLMTFAAADLLADMANEMERAFRLCCVFNAQDDGVGFAKLARQVGNDAAGIVRIIDEAGILKVSDAYAEMADPITDKAGEIIADGIDEYMKTYKGKQNF